MRTTCTKVAVALTVLAVCITACETVPQPVRYEGWEAGASSAAGAEPAPGVRTAREANVRAEAVVATAMKAVVSAQPSSAGGPDAQKPAPVVAVADLEPPADIHTPPGPEASADEVARWLSAAWKRDKPATWIRNHLERKKPTKLEGSRIAVQSGDFDGDDKPDLAAAFFADCADASCTDSSANSGGHWTVGVVWGDAGWSRLATSQRFAPKFVGPTDLTGDAHPELIFTIKQCGAHTCYLNVQVLSAHGDQRFRRILYLGDDVEGHGSRGLVQKVELVEAPEAEETNGTLSGLEISGGLVGSAGAGSFQRTSSTRWIWQPEHGKLERVDTRWEPSELRLHRFHDAIVALDRSHRSRAQDLLSEVIENDTLDELPSDAEAAPGLAEALRTQLAHTARFMLARLALERGDTDRFARLRDELEAVAPDSPATRAVVKLDESWRGKKRAAEACQAAAAVFPEASDDEWVLDSLQLGYNAPVTFDAGFERGLCVGTR